MTDLEKIGIQKLREIICDILEDASDKNDGRMDHVRPFLKSKAINAIAVITALEENHKQQ